MGVDDPFEACFDVICINQAVRKILTAGEYDENRGDKTHRADISSGVQRAGIVFLPGDCHVRVNVITGAKWLQAGGGHHGR